MPGALEVVSLYATLSLNDTMTRGLRQAGREAESFGQRMQRTGRSISAFGAGMSQALSPVTDFLTGGINVAADFERSMAEIQARTGITADELARVQDVALEMGAATAFSAQQAADAFLQLLSSGQTMEQAISTLPSVLSAAAASGMELGAAADGVTDVLAMFGLEVSDAESVVNSLSKAAGASSATMPDLLDALSNVGPVASQFGMSVNETVAALAALSENGIKGAEAGTALKSMLLQMAQNTPAATAAWEELGTSLYDANGNMRDMDTVLDELGAALSELPVEEQNRLMMDLAGSYGIMALSALTGRVGISEMEDAMTAAAGAAEVADARMAGWSGANEALQGSLETLQIQALTPLMENVLTPLVQELTTVVNSVTEWVEANPELASTLITILGAGVLLLSVMVPLGIAVSAAGTAFGALAAAAGVIGGVMGTAIGPILMVGAAVGAVIAQINEFNRLVGAGAAAAGAAADANGITNDQLWDVVQREAQAQWGPEMGYAIGSYMYYQIPGRAAGGPVTGGSPYMVGEEGPELFVPHSSGAIIPNGAMSGGVVVNLTTIGTGERDVADFLLRALRDRGL